MTLNLKSIFKRKIQHGYKIAIPKDVFLNNQLHEGQKIEIMIIEKGETINSNGLFIRFLE